MRIFTKSLLALALTIVCVGGAKSQDYQIYERKTSVAAGDVVAIVNETDGTDKAFYGSGDNNLAYDVYTNAFKNTNATICFKLEAVTGGFLLRAMTPGGAEYSVYGGPGYLNSQEVGGYCCFIQGLNNQNGQDILNGAVWDIQYSTEKGGFSIKNVGTNKYLKDATPAKYDEATYFTLAEVVEVYDPDTSDPGVADIPAGSVSLIKNGTLAGDDVSSFFTKVNKGSANPSTITADAGRFAGRGIKITSIDNASDGWDTQFWVKFDRPVNSGTKIHIEFDYRSSEPTTVSSQEHGGNCNYVWYAGLNEFSPSINWKHFSQDFTVSKGDENADITIQSIAFNLNDTRNKAIDFYFDNFLVYAEKTDFTVTEAGWGTFSFNDAVHFGSDVEAYAAKYDAGSVKLTAINSLRAGKGAIIKATAESHYAIVNETPSFTDADNDLQVSNGSVEGNGSTIYALGKKNDVVGFVKVKSGVTIPAGKAYLTISAGARDFIGFDDDDVTSIESVEQAAKVDNQYFNLAGQRVAQPTKGLYIVNGKKVILK